MRISRGASSVCLKYQVQELIFMNERLKKCFKLTKIQKEEVAEKIGVSRATVYRMLERNLDQETQEAIYRAICDLVQEKLQSLQNM